MTRARQYGVYRHVRTGGVYRVLHVATLQTRLSVGLEDKSEMIVYERAGVAASDGRVFTRERSEFEDGRFVEVGDGH